MKRVPTLMTATLMAAACLLAGCASPRNSLGTGSTACFKAIPPAEDAVHHKGKPVGVREVNASSLARRHPEFARLGNETLCVMAFRGVFKPGDVPDAPAPQTGTYAVIAVDVHTLKVVGAWVTQTLPMRFRHPV